MRYECPNNRSHAGVFTSGQGNGSALVFVHGYLGGSAMWSDELAYFSDRFDVIAPDLPGYGASNHLLAIPSIRGQGQAVLDLLTSLSIERFCLVGHSMGGMIVQEMTALAPERIEKLVLYGTGPLGVIPGRFETIDRSRERIREDGVEASVRRIAATWYMDGEKSPGFLLCAETGLRAREQALFAGLTAMEGWDGRPNLANIKIPTMVLWGDQDRTYTWPQVEELWRGIHDCSLAVVPKAAHNVHEEAPGLFAAAVGRFLS